MREVLFGIRGHDVVEIVVLAEADVEERVDGFTGRADPEPGPLDLREMAYEPQQRQIRRCDRSSGELLRVEPGADGEQRAALPGERSLEHRPVRTDEGTVRGRRERSGPAGRGHGRSLHDGLMISITRHRVPTSGGEQFLAAAQDALAALAQRPGFLVSRIGRSTDDPELWVLVSEWESVGTYRRALSAYDVKVRAVPVLATAIDEPTAYELVESRGSARAADAATVGVGSASAAQVISDLPAVGGSADGPRADGGAASR